MWTEEKLNELLTTPSDALVEDMKKIKGDIMILGAGGKMGPTLCTLAKNAINAVRICLITLILFCSEAFCQYFSHLGDLLFKKFL